VFLLKKLKNYIIKHPVFSVVILLLLLYILVTVYLAVSFTVIYRTLNRTYGVITPEIAPYFSEYDDPDRIARWITQSRSVFARNDLQYYENFFVKEDKFNIYFIAHCFLEARIYYGYSYEAVAKNGEYEGERGFGGASHCYIDFEFKHFKWVIVNHYETP